MRSVWDLKSVKFALGKVSIGSLVYGAKSGIEGRRNEAYSGVQEQASYVKLQKDNRLHEFGSGPSASATQSSALYKDNPITRAACDSGRIYLLYRGIR